MVIFLRLIQWKLKISTSVCTRRNWPKKFLRIITVYCREFCWDFWTVCVTYTLLNCIKTCFSAKIILCSKLIKKSFVCLFVCLFIEPWEKLAVEEPKVLCVVSFLSSPERLSTIFKSISLFLSSISLTHLLGKEIRLPR